MRKKIIPFLMVNSVIWVFLLAKLFVISSKEIIPNNWLENCVFLIFLIFVFQTLQMILLKFKLSNFIVVYSILQFVFLYGRIVLKYFNLDSINGWNLFAYYSPMLVYQSVFFSLCFSQGIFLGFLIWGFPKLQYRTNTLTKNKKYSSYQMKIVGIAVLLICLPFLAYTNYATILAQKSSEYVAVPQISGYIVAVSQVFFAGIIMLIISPSLSRKKTNLLVAMYFIYGLIYMILSADRRQIIITFIVTALVYFDSYKVKINVKKIILILLVSLLLLNLLTSISSVRMDGITLDNVMKQFYFQLTSENIFVKTISEFGNTFFTLPSAMTFYPEQLHFLYGKTYIFSFLVAIPGISQFIFTNAFNSTLIFGILQNLDGNPLGGSLPQDLYVNFGISGILLSPILALILSKFLNRKENPTKFDQAMYFISFYLLLNFVRTGFLESVRSYLYAIILVYFLFFIVHSLTMSSPSEMK